MSKMGITKGFKQSKESWVVCFSSFKDKKQIQQQKSPGNNQNHYIIGGMRVSGYLQSWWLITMHKLSPVRSEPSGESTSELNRCWSDQYHSGNCHTHRIGDPILPIKWTPTMVPLRCQSSNTLQYQIHTEGDTSYYLSIAPKTLQ